MIVEYILFIAGLILLIKSADFVVSAASTLTKKLGVSVIVVGLTIVAFGTSLPELVLNILAAVNGSPEIVFGNVIGSNIANILLILGITSIITNVKLKSSTIWREIPFALLSSFVLIVLTYNAFISSEPFYIGIKESLLMLSFFSIFLYYLIQQAAKDRSEVKMLREVKEGYGPIYAQIIIGIIGISLAANWVVDGAIFIAVQLGFTEFFVSATALALGTSLPELVVTLSAIKKKNVDLAVGNIIGSNIFNILLVIGVVPLFGPLLVPSFISFDLAVMFIATLVLFIFVGIGRTHELRFREGIIFLMMYVGYILFLLIRG